MKKIEKNQKRDTTPSIPELFESLKYDLKKAELFTFAIYDYCDVSCLQYIHTCPIERTIEDQMDYQNMNYGRFRLMELTKFFGVTFEPGKGVYMSESFIKWYRFWKNYSLSMPEEEWDEFEVILFSGGDVSEYLPDKNWNDE